LDLSALTSSQVSGKFQMSSTSVLKFPSDMAFDACTNSIAIDSADTESPKGKGARIEVKGVTYVYNGTWGVATYPSWLDEADDDTKKKYDEWAADFGVSDPDAANKDAFVLNCDNTDEAVATALAAFKITSISVDSSGESDDVAIGLETPEGGFNGTITILGSATVDGTYSAMESTTSDGLYHVTTTTVRLFKASLDL